MHSFLLLFPPHFTVFIPASDYTLSKIKPPKKTIFHIPIKKVNRKTRNVDARVDIRKPHISTPFFCSMQLLSRQLRNSFVCLAGDDLPGTIVVRVGNNRPDLGTNPICNRFTGPLEEGQPLFLPCNPPMPGAFVSVHLEAASQTPYPVQLSLCEAFVYTDQVSDLYYEEILIFMLVMFVTDSCGIFLFE